MGSNEWCASNLKSQVVIVLGVEVELDRMESAGRFQGGAKKRVLLLDDALHRVVGDQRRPKRLRFLRRGLNSSNDRLQGKDSGAYQKRQERHEQETGRMECGHGSHLPLPRPHSPLGHALEWEDLRRWGPRPPFP